MTATPCTPWTAQSYHPIVVGSGASKLADSGVAPLVAAARGYHSVVDKDGAKQLADNSTAATGHRALTNRIVRLLRGGTEDLLVIPWYRASAVAEQGIEARSRTTQYRPSAPEMDEKGKVRKYLFLPGENTTLDFHPSTPLEWITSSTRILLTEGALKGDSGLTALLRANGVSDEDLALPETPEDARTKLAELMLTVPVHRRVPIASLAGVANWTNQTDWHAIKLTDRELLVAFDGDVATNWNVWKQASKLFDFVDSKGGQANLVNLSSPTAQDKKTQAGLPSEEKLGLDDYLSKVGTWDDVLSFVDNALPPEPERAQSEVLTVGEWRVHPTMPWLVEEYTAEQDEFGGTRARWVPRVNIGGRLLSTESRRRPSRDEVASGQLDPALDAELSHNTCTLELTWLDPASGEPSTAVVTGSAEILDHAPGDWSRYGANIPNSLRRQKEWPPRKGMEWLSAVKGNRPEDVEERNGWETMGWVPVEGGSPVFIVGNTKVGRTRDDQDRTIVGVTDKVLGGASTFGVIDRYWDDDVAGHTPEGLEVYRKMVRDDIKAVLDGFIENGVWKHRPTAVTAVAAMLRPTIPAPTRATIYVYGPPRAGKTFFAAFVMAGWQRRPGRWSVNHLPGAAGDTLPSIEYSIARTPIWPADDLAPSVDRRKAEIQEAQVGDLIRAVHNGSARRKMDQGTKAQQAQAEPTALFMITAENEPQVASVRERVVAINIPNNSYGSEEAIANLRELCDDDGAPARLTAAMIRYFTLETGNKFGDSWAERTEVIKEEILETTRHAEWVLQSTYNISAGEAARHAKIAAEFVVSFEVLRALASWAGMPDDDPIMQMLTAGEGSYAYDLFEMAARTIKRQRESTPGRSLVQALSKLMLSGRAHVENPNSPGTPPAEVNPADGDNAAAIAAHINRTLGWNMDAQGAWTARGTAIGHFGVTSKGERTVLFDAVNAFREAQRNYPNLILPGANATVSWASVWSEGLCSEQSYKKREDTNTVSARLSDVRMHRQFSNIQRIQGVPVMYESVVDPLDGADESGQLEQ